MGFDISDAMQATSPMQWPHQTWCRADGRYYSCSLRQNLFREWVLIRQWGTLHSKRGRTIELSCQSYEEGLAGLAQVGKHRKQRGYGEI